MLKTRLAAAQRIANHVRNAEEAVDDAIISLSTLVAALPTERRAINLPPMLGHDAVAKATRALALSADLRSALIEAHAALHAAQGEAGLAAFAIGPSTERPMARLEPEIESDHRLRVV
jgi:hypothetical protein